MLNQFLERPVCLSHLILLGQCLLNSFLLKESIFHTIVNNPTEVDVILYSDSVFSVASYSRCKRVFTR